MNKNKIIISVLSLTFALNASTVFAQDYVIPAPECVDTVEIPCPGKGHSYENTQKPAQTLDQNAPTGLSKLFEYMSSLATKIGDLADYTKEGLKNWFRGVYDGLLHRFGKVK